MRCYIELDAKALKANYKILSEASAPATLIPVVKSNAYGHGLKETVAILDELNPQWLAVNYIQEGLELRSLGYSGRVLVVGPPEPKSIEVAAKANIEVIIGDFDFLKAWKERKLRPTAHIKIDTGMSRQGFLAEQCDKVIEQLKDFKSQVYGISSHFANVEDVLAHDYANHQLSTFQRVLETFTSGGFKLHPHMASSASTLLIDESLFDYTRVGISLYGFWPSSKTKLSYLQTKQKVGELSPVLSWRTEVSSIKSVKKGQYIGYGCTFKATHDMTIAVLPVGYYEGYPRLAGEKGSYVLYRGERCPIVGRVCMNMMMIDVSHIHHPETGQVVTLIGKDGAELVTAEDIAEWAETIHYELVTCLNPAIPRRIM